MTNTKEPSLVEERLLNEAREEIERLLAQLTENSVLLLSQAGDNERLRSLLREAWSILPSSPFRDQVGRAVEQKP